MEKRTEPMFERRANATLKRVTATFGQRGTEYGDTLADCQWLAMKATARELGVIIPDEFLRAIAVAALVDIKYQRLQGGYKDDTVVDGIAYGAVYAEEMRVLKGESK
jgi:hypothetical protein